MRKKLTRESGFTLLELLVAIAILAVLTTLAMHSFRDIMERQKIRSALNEWQNSFYFAQREAMRLKEPVRFCASSNGIVCDAAAVQFNQGWIVTRRVGDNWIVLQDNAFRDESINIHLSKNNGLIFRGNGSVAGVNNDGSIAGGLFLATLTIGPLAAGGNPSVAPPATGHNVVTMNISAGGRLVGVKR